MRIILALVFTCFIMHTDAVYAQKNFKVKLNTYSGYVIKSGKVVYDEIIGSKCKLNFKKDLYTLTFQSKRNTEAYQKFKIVSRNKDEVIVKIVGDLAPKPKAYIVRDSIDLKRKIDFISVDTGEVYYGMRISD